MFSFIILVTLLSSLELFLVPVRCVPIKLTGNATEEFGLSLDNPCMDAACPVDKICVSDSKSEEGYKCCKNNKCNAKTRCKDPGSVENASRIPHMRKFHPKEKVIYECNQGYYLKSAERSPGIIYCKEDGNWTMPKPVCIKIRIPIPSKPKPSTKSPVQESTEEGSKNSNQSEQTLIIIIVALLILLLLGAGIFIFRNKQQTGNYFPVCQREMPNAVVLENAIMPDMPVNLDKLAIPKGEFAQYVALGHNNTDQKFCEEFEDIQHLALNGPTWDTSLLPENKDKNRYINIVAYDHSRVRLQSSGRRKHSGLHRSSDYINANYVSSFEKPKEYIACQGPMPNTFNDFWKMIWENNVSVIIMITNLVENGRRKCDRYWPQEGREQYKHINVTLRDTDVYANYTIRQFQIRNSKLNRRHYRNEERKVLQFHYTQWPDHGTPEYILPVLTFIRRSSSVMTSDSGPMVIHCSAGVGRTGAYIMLHSMMQMARATGRVNINGFLRFIRTQRNYLVQTEDQYIFVHDALLCHFTCGDTECPARRLDLYVKQLLSVSSPKNGNQGDKANGRNDKGSPYAQLNGSSAKEGKETKNLKKNVGERTGMEKQFMNIAHYIDRDIDYDFALRAVNQGKNRMNGILPIFRSRVPLHYRVGKEGSDYINASFVQGYRNSKKFIVTQLPMTNTKNDFWQLIWDHNCSVIITIRDKEWTESDTYWPTQFGHLSCDSFNVSFGSESPLPLEHEGPTSLTVRDFILEATKDDYVLAVKQLDISHWPSIDELQPQLVQLIQTIGQYTQGKEGSIVIQDRFGGTSAGQLACIHSLHEQLGNENVVDVFQTVKVAYQMRPRMFSSHTHLHFIYKAMLLETNPPPMKKQPTKAAAAKSISNKSSKSAPAKGEQSSNKGDGLLPLIQRKSPVGAPKSLPSNGGKKLDNDELIRDTKVNSEVKIEENNVFGDNLEESCLMSASEEKPLLSIDGGAETNEGKGAPDALKDEVPTSPASSTSERNEMDQSRVTENTLLLD